jgi:hypothetical protein
MLDSMCNRIALCGISPSYHFCCCYYYYYYFCVGPVVVIVVVTKLEVAIALV